MRPELILAGAVVGFLVGLTGIGGGSLLTPILILFFHIRASSAIATGVVWMALTKLLGAIRHRRLGTVNRQMVRFLCLGGIPGTIVGCAFTALLAKRFPAQMDLILTRILAAVLILVGVLMYVQAWLGKARDPESTRGNWMGNRRKPFTICIGFLGGISMAVTSGGAGSLVMVLVVLLYPLSASSIVGSDVVYGAVIASLAGVLHATFEHIDGALLGNLLIGSLPGIVLGSALCARLPDKILRPVLATVLFLTGVKMA